jgi:hypothetical protein
MVDDGKGSRPSNSLVWCTCNVPRHAQGQRRWCYDSRTDPETGDEPRSWNRTQILICVCTYHKQSTCIVLKSPKKHTLCIRAAMDVLFSTSRTGRYTLLCTMCVNAYFINLRPFRSFIGFVFVCMSVCRRSTSRISISITVKLWKQIRNISTMTNCYFPKLLF